MFVYEDTTSKAKIYISNHSTHEQSYNNCYNLPSEGSEHLLSLQLIVELYFSQKMGSKYESKKIMSLACFAIVS